MKLLIDAGANPNIATKAGSTALQAAAGMMIDFQGTNVVPEAGLETAKYLVEELGADVNARDDKGYSVLHAAAFVGHNDVILYLVSKGADITVRASQISNGASGRPAPAGQGDTVADMANGWTEKVLQFPETVDLARKLGSGFSNYCFASLCVNPTRLDKPATKPQD
jgi:ankyrin repeat protein